MKAETVSRWVTERPATVVLLFVVITALFVPALDDVEIQEDLEDFVVDTPEYETLQEVNDEFEPAFGGGGVETWLIQDGDNVLSRTGVLRMLRAEERLIEHDDLYVEGAESAASRIALEIDPTATTAEERRRAVEDATPDEVREAVRSVADDDFERIVSDDFNVESAYAGATVSTVVHDFPGKVDTEAVTGADEAIQDEQLRMRNIVETAGGEIRVYGFGIMYHEFSLVIEESMVLLLPLIMLLIVGFLGVAYRDLLDLLLGLVCLLVALVWTFGFMGYAGVPFTQLDVAIPPLMLAVGVDFSIHMVNRYREEKVIGYGDGDAMDIAARQLIVAFGIVTATTSIGFFANLTSGLGPVRDFGLVAGVSIIFVALVFGVLFPAAKLLLDNVRDGWLRFTDEPLGREGSALGRVLSYGAVPARRPFVFLLLVLVVSSGAAFYATGVDTSFDDEDFLPPEEMPGYVNAAPEPMQPSDYTTKRDMSFISDEFEADVVTVTVHLEGRIDESHALESMVRAADDAPNRFIRYSDGSAGSESVLDVIDEHADRDEEFARLVERNDISGNGVPDRNLDEVFDAVLTSEARDDAVRFVNDDRDEAVIQYYVESDAFYEDIHDDARGVMDDHRLDAAATGDIIIYSSVSELVLSSAFNAFIAALVLTTVVLMVAYRLTEGYGALGVANTVPIAVTAVFVVATMRFLGIPFNALTATILALTVGVGIDYSVHMTHRFADELDGVEDSPDEALRTALRGTGGALTGSMATTVAGTGALILAVTPILQEFGFLMVVSITYAYLGSVVVLPSALRAWFLAEKKLDSFLE